MKKLDVFKGKIMAAVKKYYGALLLFMVATINLMVVVWQSYKGKIIEDNSIKLILTLILGGIIFIVVREILARKELRKKRFLFLYTIVPILMILVYFGILKDFETPFSIIKYAILGIISFLLFLIVPFLGQKEDSECYTYKILINAALTKICYLILILGIFITLKSISLLFEITIKEYVYLEIAIFLLGFIIPLFFLSGLPQLPLERKSYPNYLKKILISLIFPILSLYTLVLYVYFLKMLIELKWPANILGNLVIYYSLFSLAFLYFINNLKNEDKSLGKLVKIYSYLLILPLIMMFLSFIYRIDIYGFTEARYYAITCFFFGMISIFVLRKYNRTLYIPLTLVVLLAISTFGPQSAFNVSKLSQEKRLEEILIDNNMLKDNKIIKNENLTERKQKEIVNILEYFFYYHNLKDLDFLPQNFDLNKIEDTFGFSYYESYWD